jgi:hypothetical protein
MTIDHDATPRGQTKRAAFERLLSEWLLCRAEAAVADHGDDEEVFDLWNRRADRSDELVRLMATMPATEGWMVLRKLEVLEWCLSADGTMWADNREIVLAAGIKADLLRFAMEGEKREPHVVLSVEGRDLRFGDSYYRFVRHAGEPASSGMEAAHG